MANQTDNHSLNKPAAGSTDWHIPLNSDRDKLEPAIEVRDTDGNKGSYTAHDGAKFLATDTGKVYLGDGSKWNQIGTIEDPDLTNYARTDQAETFTSDLTVDGNLTAGTDIVASSGTTIWDAANDYIPGGTVQSGVFAPSGHTHGAGDLDGAAVQGDVPKYNGTDVDWRQIEHIEIINVGSDDHHTRYSDTEAVDAVNAETSLTVNISGDADTVDTYHGSDLVKYGDDVDRSQHLKDPYDGEDIDVSAGSTDPGSPDTGKRIWFSK